MREYFRIDTIAIDNFRHFEHLEIEFNVKPRIVSLDGKETEVGPLTVIVAKNGMGKSATLDAIRVAFGTYTSAFDYPSPVHIAKSDIRIAASKSLSDFRQETPVTVGVSGMIASNPVTWRRSLEKETGRTTNRDAHAITGFGKKLKLGIVGGCTDTPVLPLIAYYGTSRLWREHKDTEQDRPLLKPRDFGYNTCLADNSNYKSVYRWITNALQAEMMEHQINARPGDVSRQLQAIRNALTELLGHEGYTNFLHYNPYVKELAVARDRQDDGDGEQISIPISSLSDGVRAIFSMVTDIAFRCAKLNPAFGEVACRKTPGIILIDEIDQHLHPAWQQTILDTLQAAFPMMQFVVTTHSPQVISSIPNECVRILGEDTQAITPTDQTQGVESQRILADIFETHSAPQGNPYVRMLAKYAKLEANGLAETDEARELYTELVKHFGVGYPPLQRIEIHRQYMQRRKEHAHA